MSERTLLSWIRSRIGRRGGVAVDSGDDAALVCTPEGRTLFKVDSVIEGIHFDKSARAEEVGHKALARNLSDIAAMGGIPTFAVVAVAIPRGMEDRRVRRLVIGMERTARNFGVKIVGGDIASHRGGLAVTVALLGEMRGARPVLRSGARPGDAVAVTGPLGGAILGKHLRFVPRVTEARALCRRFDPHSMIDISDGLTTDLGHICEESRVGAEIEEELVPIAPAARRLSRRDGRPALEHALEDGEDYELLFTLPVEQGARLERSGLGRVIGRIVKGHGLRLRRRDGRLEDRAPRGWEHRW